MVSTFIHSVQFSPSPSFTQLHLFCTSACFSCSCCHHLSAFLLLEDTPNKWSFPQRYILHTIFLAFNWAECNQLCWKLNSLTPPFPLQQFIVDELNVFGEQLLLSRGWCQREAIVPLCCSVSDTLPLVSPDSFLTIHILFFFPLIDFNVVFFALAVRLAAVNQLHFLIRSITF